MENKEVLNDDVVLETPKEEELKKEASENEVLDFTNGELKDTEILPEEEPKDLILNKEKFIEELRKKLYTQNEVTSPAEVEKAGLVVNPGPGIDVAPDTTKERQDSNKTTTNKSVAFLKEKLQEILVQLEEMDEEPVEIKTIEEEGAIPGGAAAAAGPGVTTDAIAQYKEKIGKFSQLYKRKKD